MPAAHAKVYTGVFPIAPTPFTTTGELDPDGMRRVLECTDDKSPWRNALAALREIIQFRLAMRQELAT